MSDDDDWDPDDDARHRAPDRSHEEQLDETVLEGDLRYNFDRASSSNIYDEENEEIMIGGTDIDGADAALQREMQEEGMLELDFEVQIEDEADEGGCACVIL